MALPIPEGAQKLIKWKSEGKPGCILGCKDDCSVHVRFSKVEVTSNVEFKFDNQSITFKQTGFYRVFIRYQIDAHGRIEIRITEPNGGIHIEEKKLSKKDRVLVFDRTILACSKLEVLLTDLKKCDKIDCIYIKGTIALLPPVV